MMKKWLIIPALLLLPSCQSDVQDNSLPHALMRNEIVDNIKIGDKIIVEPKTLTYEGVSRIVNGQIILPDGTNKTGKSFVIEMPGIYEVNYRTFFGTHEESLSIYYHCHRTSGDFFISSNKDNPSLTGEYSYPISDGSIKGAKLLLDSRTTFTFDGEIDFNTYDPNKSFLEFAIDPSIQDSSDIETFTVRLTDTENSNNYVDINVTDSGPIDDDGRGSYWKAGSNNQFKTGYENGRSSTLHDSSSKYGTNVGMSFRNLPKESATVAKLYFNYSEKELYVSPIINSKNKNIITDLDDKEIYGSNIWEGFTNGKASISIFATSLLNNYATLIVSKVGGFDLSPLDFVDEDAPTIKVNYNGQSPIYTPMATVNKPYKIFEAEVSDNYNHDLSYSTYVTYFDEEYNVTKDITVSNGYFTPKKEGEYTITYVAKDYSNNYVEKTVDVIAVNDAQTMTITLDEDSISRDIYSVIDIPSINDIKTKITGGSGNPVIERIITDIDGNELEIEGDSFIPTEVGEYIVLYKATDYIGNIATATITINATNPGHPVFIDDFNIPKVFLKGHKYTLPTYLGAEVVDNKTVYLGSKIYVNDELLIDNTFTAESDTCVIKYQLEGETGEEHYIASIDVVDVGDPIDLGRYFYGDYETVVNKNDVTLSAIGENASALFASILPYDNLYVSFAIEQDKFTCDELVFKFTDTTNYNNTLSFRFSVNGAKKYISIGQDQSKYEFAGFIEEEEESFVLDFSTTNRALKDIYQKDVAVIKYNDQGNYFTGFGGGVYLEVMMNNIKDSSEVKMLTISNQTLGHRGRDPYKDFINPVVILKDSFLTEQDYNVNAFLPVADVFDVLSSVDVTLTVKAPDGTNKITDVDATKSHTFLLDQFGRYIVTYTARDSAGRTTRYSRTITVYDTIPPKLTINGSLNEQYSINSAITIPSYTVSDNLNKYTVDVFLILPNEEERLLLVDENGSVTSYLSKDNSFYNSSFKVDDRTFRAEQYGQYILRYVTYDTDFNKSVKELRFVVK